MKITQTAEKAPNYYIRQMDEELGTVHFCLFGQEVYVTVNPKGLTCTFTTGNVSAVRLEGKLIQMSDPIYPGSSGNPVPNSHAEVIGISFAQY